MYTTTVCRMRLMPPTDPMRDHTNTRAQVAEKRPALADTIMEQYKFVRGQTDCDDCAELSVYSIAAADGDFQVLQLVKRRPHQAAGAGAGAAAAAT